MAFSGHLEIDHSVRKSPPVSELIRSGFSEFTQTTIDGLLSIPFIHKSAQIASGITSSVSNHLFDWVPIHQIWEKMMLKKKRRQNRPTLMQRLVKWRVFQLSLYVIERFLGVIERTISPLQGKHSPTPSVEFHDNTCLPEEFGALPKLLKVRFLSSSSNTRTPNNRNASEDTSTPFSVNSSNESVFDRSCASLMDDLSHTVNVPVIDGMRQKIVSKIQTWRQYIRNLDQSDEFPSWSPQCTTQNDQTSLWMVHIWRPVLNWLNLSSVNNSANKPPDSAQRKRKRPDGDEEDVALFITFHKGIQSLNSISTTIPEQAENHEQSKTIEEPSNTDDEGTNPEEKHEDNHLTTPILEPETDKDNKAEALEHHDIQTEDGNELGATLSQDRGTELKPTDTEQLQTEWVDKKQTDHENEIENQSYSDAKNPDEPVDVCGRGSKLSESDYESQPESDFQEESGKCDNESETYQENQESNKQDDGDCSSEASHKSKEADKNDSDYSE